jgi:predicted ester cyclase
LSEQARNISVVKAYYEAWNRHDMDAAIAYFSAETRNHGRPVGHAGLRMVWADILLRFPDAQQGIIDVLAAGSDVVVLNTYAGTHSGVGRLAIDGGLLVGVAPTNRTFSVQHIHWFTLQGGLIVEHRATRDDIGMMVQLGLLSPPPAMVVPR